MFWIECREIRVDVPYTLLLQNDKCIKPRKNFPKFIQQIIEVLALPNSNIHLYVIDVDNFKVFTHN